MVRCFSGNSFMSFRTKSICSLRSSYRSGVEPSDISCVSVVSSMFWASDFWLRSMARFLATVRQKASIELNCAHSSRLFHTLIIVSCTISSASALSRVMRNANLYSLSFSGNISFRKLISFIAFYNNDGQVFQKLHSPAIFFELFFD